MTKMAENSAMGGGEIIGGIALGLLNNELARSRESQGRQENFGYNELAAENADKRTRALYNDLMSPEALLKQYKNAGISPSLMFGGGGVGGQVAQGAQGAGVAGINPTAFGVDAAQLAQIEVAHAQARALNAEADRKEGKNAMGEAEINQIIANTQNTKLKSDWQALTNMLTHWETAIKGTTLEEATEAQRAEYGKIATQYKILQEELRSAKAKGEIDEKTVNATINYIDGKVLNQTAERFLMYAKTKHEKAAATMDIAFAEKLMSEVGVLARSVDVKEGQLKLDKEKLQKQVEQWGIQNGLTEREQNIEIAKTVVDFIESEKENLIDLLQMLPTPAKKPAKIGF